MPLLSQDIAPIPGFAEPFSAMSHLLAAGAFAVLSVWMIRRAWGHAGRVVVIKVFCFAVLFLLSMSGVYHLLRPGSAGRFVLNVLDHAAIFTLIAATITAVHALLFRRLLRWGMIILVWALAATAITLKSIWFSQVPELLSLALYLGMGWMGVISGVALWRRFDFAYIRPLLAGGLAYSVGAVAEFARWPTMIPGVIGPHELFHVAVLAGLGCHWYFIYGIAGGRVEPVQVRGRLA